MDFYTLVVLYIIIGAILGAIINFTGVGGGVLLIPVLSVVFNLEPAAAVGTASLYAVLTKLFSSYQHLKLGNVDYKIMALFLINGVIGALIVSITFTYLISTIIDVEQAELVKQIQLYIIVFIIIFSVIITALDIYLKDIKKQDKYKEQKEMHPFYISVSAFFVGLVMGATGIGGGILIVPALLYTTRLSIQKIVGVSIISALVISIMTSLVYAKGGQIDYTIALLMSVGSLIIIPLTAKLMKVIPVLTLKVAILLLIILSGLLMLLK